MFTLGVTGSGKVFISDIITDETHTVFGESSNPGIIPFSLKGLFEAIESQKATVFAAYGKTNHSALTLIVFLQMHTIKMASVFMQRI